MALSEFWEGQAEAWVRWARAPGHDSYWQFHRDRFLELLDAAVREASRMPLFLHLRAVPR